MKHNMPTPEQMTDIRWKKPEAKKKQAEVMRRVANEYWAKFTPEEKSEILKERALKRKK